MCIVIHTHTTGHHKKKKKTDEHNNQKKRNHLQWFEEMLRAFSSASWCAVMKASNDFFFINDPFKSYNEDLKNTYQKI